MIKAIKGNLMMRCEHFDVPAEEVALKKALTFTVPNYFFAKAWKRGVWDGTKSFYNGYSKSFPTGLFISLPPKLKERFVISDSRVKPVFERKELNLEGIELRDYQEKAIKKCVELERCIVEAATNAGKTEIACGIMQMVPVRVLWLTHRGNLMLQTQRRIQKRIGEEVGLVVQDTVDINKRITIAMVQTLSYRISSAKRLVRGGGEIVTDPKVRAFFKRWLKNDIDMLIMDECHRVSSPQWFNIAKQCNAFYRYGLSATPLMGDEIGNSKLIAMTGETVDVITNQEMIERGFSAKPVIYRIQNVALQYVKTRAYDSSYELGIELNKTRNRAIADIVQTHIARKEPILCLVDRKRHGELLKKEIDRDNVIYIDGSCGYEQRMIHLDELESGKLGAIIATQIFEEGADVPNIRVLILASGGRSHLWLIQRIGRVMREKPTGENRVVIYDFEDKGDRFLEEHSEYRMKLYHKEGFEVIPAQLSSGMKEVFANQNEVTSRR